MNEIVEIGPWRLLLAYGFLVLLLLLVKSQGIGKEREIFFSALRMTVQLMIMGYVLIYIFDQNHLLLTLLVFLFMEIFAIRNIYRRVQYPIKNKLRQVIVFSMVAGTTFTLFYFLFLVLSIEPWYHARYFVPIAGMVIGNSMTGISLGVERLVGEMKSKKHLVEGALMLGATPKEATLNIVRDTFTSAIMPTINSMMGMGIVFLPGMMTGQILSGVSPVIAIEYQIAIMMGILGSVSITVFLFTRLGYLSFFNRYHQLEE